MKRNTVIIIIIALLVAVGLFAWWQASQRPTTERVVHTEDQTVAIEDFAFTPSTLTVKKGVTVTWENRDAVGHNVLADDATNGGGLPAEADLLNEGESFSVTFDQVGTYSYHCGPHPNMKGTVEVVE
jgi:amicyanin